MVFFVQQRMNERASHEDRTTYAGWKIAIVVTVLTYLFYDILVEKRAPKSLLNHLIKNFLFFQMSYSGKLGSEHFLRYWSLKIPIQISIGKNDKIVIFGDFCSFLYGFGKMRTSYWLRTVFFQSCLPTGDHILGRSTGISNPAWHLLQVVPMVDQTTGSVHPQPTLPNC